MELNNKIFKMLKNGDDISFMRCINKYDLSYVDVMCGGGLSGEDRNHLLRNAQCASGNA